MNDTKKKCLIIETHSDDSCISCSGFIQKYFDEYDFYAVMLFCSGIKLYHNNSMISCGDRLKEYKDYCKRMGLTCLNDKYVAFDHDTESDTIPIKDIIKRIEIIIADIKPDLLIIQGGSFHQDHENTYKAAIAALRPCCGFYPKKIWVMENPTYVHYDRRLNNLAPNVFIELTREEVENKLKIFEECFPSQVRESGNYLSNEGILEFARYRGIEARCRYAEAFYQISEVL